MLNRGEDTIIYSTEIDGLQHELEIAFTMGEVLNGTNESVWGIEDWRVYKIDGHPNRLGEFWAERLDEERVCEAIMNEVSA